MKYQTQNINFNKINKKIVLFKQDMFYYKFNLKLPNLVWTGTKACKKKDLESPQWLRNVKDRKYPFYRLDTFFSDTKYIDIKIISNGGWHFSNLKTASEIEFKLCPKFNLIYVCCFLKLDLRIF